MKKVDHYIKEKMKRNPDFKAHYGLLMEKAAVVKKIIRYRIQHKLSQKQLAEKIGITQHCISKIEDGEFPNLAAMGKMGTFLCFLEKPRNVPIFLDKKLIEKLKTGHLDAKKKRGKFVE